MYNIHEAVLEYTSCSFNSFSLNLHQPSNPTLFSLSIPHFFSLSTPHFSAYQFNSRNALLFCLISSLPPILPSFPASFPAHKGHTVSRHSMRSTVWMLPSSESFPHLPAHPSLTSRLLEHVQVQGEVAEPETDSEPNTCAHETERQQGPALLLQSREPPVASEAFLC